MCILNECFYYHRYKNLEIWQLYDQNFKIQHSKLLLQYILVSSQHELNHYVTK